MSDVQKPRVLVVVDDGATLKAVADALGRRGVEVIRLPDPTKSLVTAARFRPHLILIDLALEKVRGDKVLAALRKEVRTRTIPLAVLSEAKVEEPLIHAFRVGVVASVVKPFQDADADRLVELLKSLPLRTGRAEGAIGEHIVDQLLAFFERTGKSGTLILNPGSDLEARAAFAQGLLASCEVGQFNGKVALERMLLVKSGSYVFEESDEMSSDLVLGGDSGLEIDTRGASSTAAEPFGGGVSIEFEDGAAPAGGVEEIVGEIEILPEPAEEETGPPVRLLLVDDDEALLKLFAKALSASGFDVKTATNGDKGYRIALVIRPEVVVADLAMPVLDGWGLLHRIRADHRVAETPVVFLSAHDDYRQSLQAQSAGAQDYLSKGVKIEVLARRVKQVLSPRRAFAADVKASGAAKGKAELIGVQWALAAAVRLAPQGTLSVTDGWGSYDVAVKGGQVVAAVARMSESTLAAAEAVGAMIAVRRGDLSFDANRFPGLSNMSGPLAEVLAAAADRNNAHEAAALDQDLVSAARLRVNPDLYAVYTQLGPAVGRAVAALVADGFSTGEIMAKTDHSPLEIEETLRDLIRRRVIDVSGSA